MGLIAGPFFDIKWKLIMHPFAEASADAISHPAGMDVRKIEER